MNPLLLLKNFGVGGEIVILLLVLIPCLALAFYLGRSRMIAFILSLYPAILIYLQFPWLEKIIFFEKNQFLLFLNYFIVFIVFFVVIFLILNAITGKSLIYSNRRKLLPLLTLSISLWVLVLLVFHQVVTVPGITEWLPITSNYFASEKFFFWLLAVPLVLTLLSVKK